MTGRDGTGDGTADTALPSLDDVRAAAARIEGRVHRTPVLRCRSVDAFAEAEVHLKAEHLQRVGAFKARGAANAVASLESDVAAAGVAAHSSGNHAAALALAARERGVPCWIVMPRNAPRSKMAATRDFGAEVVLCEPTLPARETALAEVVARTGATEVHPYDDVRVIAGAGTAALELWEDVATLEAGALDAVVVPVGGGGLLSGTAVALAGLAPGTEIWAAEPAGADDAARSFAEGRLIPQSAPDTAADGLLTSLAPRTFRALRELCAGVVTVSETEIVDAMRLLWTRSKQVVEPSGAVGVAALADGRFAGRRVGVMVTGGNVDLDRALRLLG